MPRSRPTGLTAKIFSSASLLPSRRAEMRSNESNANYAIIFIIFGEDLIRISVGQRYEVFGPRTSCRPLRR
jgi:hypothetical protein